MELSDFDFELPAALIAQHPSVHRDASRLLTLSRDTGRVSHRRFSDLPELLHAGDLLVVNDTRVVPARLLGRKKNTGGLAEILVVRPASELPTSAALQGPVESLDWICVGQASKGLKVGTQLEFDSALNGEVVAALGNGHYRLRFSCPVGGALGDALARAGKVPLPPYIEREAEPADASRYQTVYAQAPGSVAAPTAGLHFTQALLDALTARGIDRASLTLEVGPGTFLPIREQKIADHQMHSERYQIPPPTVEKIVHTRRQGGRVVAVGTTVVRALESATPPGGDLHSGPGETRLFIRPGFAFRQVDALLTNFHLPRSTLLMLICAFAGREHTLSAYRQAVSHGYRFFSYGDAMFIGAFP